MQAAAKEEDHGEGNGVEEFVQDCRDVFQLASGGGGGGGGGGDSNGSNSSADAHARVELVEMGAVERIMDGLVLHCMGMLALPTVGEEQDMTVAVEALTALAALIRSAPGDWTTTSDSAIEAVVGYRPLTTGGPAPGLGRGGMDYADLLLQVLVYNLTSSNSRTKQEMSPDEAFDRATLAERWCRLIADVAFDDGCRDRLGDAGVVEAVIQYGLQVHGRIHATAAAQACAALRNLTFASPPNKRRVQDADGPRAVLDCALRPHGKTSQIVAEEACSALTNLAADDSIHTSLLRLGACEAIIESALRPHVSADTSSSTVHWALAALFNMCFTTYHLFQDRPADAGAIDTVLLAMQTLAADGVPPHARHMDIVLQGCQTLDRLLAGTNIENQVRFRLSNGEAILCQLARTSLSASSAAPQDAERLLQQVCQTLRLCGSTIKPACTTANTLSMVCASTSRAAACSAS